LSKRIFYTKINRLRVFIQHAYYKIIAEEHVTFIDKLSVTAFNNVDQFHQGRANVKHDLDWLRIHVVETDSRGIYLLPARN